MELTDNNAKVQASLCRSSQGVSLIAMSIVAILELMMLGYTVVNPALYVDLIWRYRAFYIFLLVVAVVYILLCLYVKNDVDHRYQAMSTANPICAVLLYGWSLAVTYSDYTVTGVVDLTVFMTFSLVAPLGFYMSPMFYGVIVGVADALMLAIILATGQVGTIINGGIFFVFQIVLGVNYLRMKTNVAKRVVEEQANALLDVLTGCPNRRAYEMEIEKLSGGTLPEDLAYIAIDMDGLKDTNDNHGHEAGDRLIVGTARCIESGIGDAGRVFRTGGDEFVVLLHASQQETEKVFAAFDASAAAWSRENGLTLSMSYGCACAIELKDERNIMELARMADGRMYRAKAEYYQRNGKERRKYFSGTSGDCPSAK